MADAPYLFSPAPGYHEYKVTSLMKGYLSTLVDQPENQEYIEQILSLIRSYTEQLTNLRLDRKSTRLNSSHVVTSRMPSSA